MVNRELTCQDRSAVAGSIIEQFQQVVAFARPMGLIAKSFD